MTQATALLIIDVQKGLVDRGIYQAETLLARIRHLADSARAAGVPVIYIQHGTSSRDHFLYPGSEGWAIHPDIAPQPGETIIHKKRPDSFHQTGLKAELDKRGIHKLIVTGMQTQVCVNATCRRAAELGYEVTLVSDAHSTFDNKSASAQKLIAKHNHALGAGIVRLQSANEIQFA